MRFSCVASFEATHFLFGTDEREGFIAMKSNPYTILLIVLLLAVTAGSGVACSRLGVYPAFFIFAGSLVLTGILFIAFVSFQARKEEKQVNKELPPLLSYDESTKTIELKQRSEAILKYLSIIEDKDYNVRHVDEKIHVGAVTVGGVTTGGVYTTGGYDRFVSSGEKLDTCMLYFNRLAKSYIVEYVKLNDSLFDEAKHSSIAEYLDDERRIVVKNELPSLTAEERKEMLNEMDSVGSKTGYYVTGYSRREHPSISKANAIVSWVCKTKC